jgi:hypothetical protein
MTDPTSFFNRRINDEPELKEFIPELVQVINILKPLRESRRETTDYIDRWLRSKVETEKTKRVDSEECLYFINDPDLTLYNKMVRWMYNYFHNLYMAKTLDSKAISYAFAYEEFVV